MSGLAAVLAGRVAGNLHQWHGNFEVADVANAVEHAGWAFAHVDGWRATTKPEVLAAFGDALAFPEWYGANFDALNDCLSDLTVDTLLLWDGWGTLARGDEHAFTVMLDLLAEPTRGAGRFVVLLRGDGPELPGSVTSLD
ncbi:barstar family protein [Nocardioides sp. JQ2195]|uniref:barstar family protein n=1 Tax=Nocardioides sp. JQ2195 TaxID=2592334 RepID=UPI00143ED730|nr:barstar family protein [Nocardioides sp. JQ2195]QIX26337.1 barstar family protein [Nocardioides sp. JQ2195]